MIEKNTRPANRNLPSSSTSNVAALNQRAGRFKRTVASPYRYAIAAVIVLACILTIWTARRSAPSPKLPVPVLIADCCAFGALWLGFGALIVARHDSLNALHEMSTMNRKEVIPALCDGLMLGQMPGGQAKLLSQLGVQVSAADSDEIRLSDEQLYLLAYWTSLIPNPAFVGTVSEEAILGLLSFFARVGRRHYRSLKTNLTPVDFDRVLSRFASGKSSRLSPVVQDAARRCHEAICNLQQSSETSRLLLRSAEKSPGLEQELVRAVQDPGNPDTLLRAQIEPAIKKDNRDGNVSS